MSGRFGSAPGRSRSLVASIRPSLFKSIPPAISHASFNPSSSESRQPDEHDGTGPPHVVPIPVNVTYCESFFSEISSRPLREPARQGAAGVKVRSIPMLLPGMSVKGNEQLQLTLKSPRSRPETESSVMTIGEAPKLVIFSVVRGLLVATSWYPKSIALADKLISAPAVLSANCAPSITLPTAFDL